MLFIKQTHQNHFAHPLWRVVCMIGEVLFRFTWTFLFLVKERPQIVTAAFKKAGWNGLKRKCVSASRQRVWKHQEALANCFKTYNTASIADRGWWTQHLTIQKTSHKDGVSNELPMHHTDCILSTVVHLCIRLSFLVSCVKAALRNIHSVLVLASPVDKSRAFNDEDGIYLDLTNVCTVEERVLKNLHSSRI